MFPTVLPSPGCPSCSAHPSISATLVAAEPPGAIPVYLPTETAAAVTGSSPALEVLKIMLWLQKFASHIIELLFYFNYFKFYIKRKKM